MKPVLNARFVFALVVLCFFVSGVAGLVYQVAWARYLSLFMGHTSYAIVAVLVAFMGGLALGNAWFGIRADKTSRPLAIYAWLEIAIGIYAFAFPYYFEFCHDLFLSVAQRLGPGHEAMLPLKFGFSFATILLPTVMMGATFPVLTKFVTRALSELRERVAALYAINSTGAVAGVLAADFWLVPALGLEGTVLVGAVLNVVVGLVALVVSFKVEVGTAVVESKPLPSSGEVERFTPLELKLALIGIGLSGFVAMLYEVAWTRLLALALGSSTHAFSLMLITFITGIAVGSWIIYRWRSLRNTLHAFAWAELALAITLFVSMFFYEYLPYWFVRLAEVLVRRPEAYPLYQLSQALICFTVMFIPAVCLGTTLPLVSRIATAELARTGRSVGMVFAVNTVGTVLGAIVTGLWLLPWIGLAQTFALGIAVNALIGIIILARHRLNFRWAIGIPIALVVFVAFVDFRFDPVWRKMLTLGLWRAGEAPRSVADYRSRARDFTMKYYQDGAGSTVNVLGWKSGTNDHLTLQVNGKADAGTANDMPTQMLTGHVPMMLRPESSEVLVVGLGSGVTAGAVVQHPTAEHVDVVEISPEVVEAARLFAHVNHGMHEHPKIRIVIDDAKSFLKITPRRYDIIISEPSNPWMAGVAGVFSFEYYESCRDRLKPGGLMVQWVQVYETNDEILQIVFRTFAAVFPYVNLWHTAGGDLMFIGAAEPWEADLQAFTDRFNHPAIQADMSRIEIPRLPVLLARELVSTHNGPFMFSREGAIHTDYFPILEYLAQRAFFVSRGAETWGFLDENLTPRGGTLLGRYMAKQKLQLADYSALTSYHLAYDVPAPSLIHSILDRWMAEDPSATFPVEIISEVPNPRHSGEVEALRLAPFVESMMEEAERNPGPLHIYESFLMQQHRGGRSIFHVPNSELLERVIQRLIETNPAQQRIYRLHLAELAWDRGDDAACLELGRAAFDPDMETGGPMLFGADPRASGWVLSRMMETLWRAQQAPQAMELYLHALRHRFISGVEGRNPVLDMIMRKVRAELEGLPEPADHLHSHR